MAKVNQNTWNRYKDCINEFHQDAFQDQVLWLRDQQQEDRWGEDGEGKGFDQIILRGLFQYNVFRNWPLTKMTETGQIDSENCVLYLNLDYLRQAGFTDNANYPVFDVAKDMFIFRGKVYKSYGDTHAAQASNEPLLFKLNLRREVMDITQINATFEGQVCDVDYGNSTFYWVLKGILDVHPDPPNAGEVKLYRFNDGAWYEMTEDGIPTLIDGNVFETVAW